MSLTLGGHLAPITPADSWKTQRQVNEVAGGLVWRGTSLHYTCHQVKNVYAGPSCQSLASQPLDVLVSALVLQALEPAALEIILQVAADVKAERRDVHQQWHYRLERAQYAVERASRQYNRVEPENRLIRLVMIEYAILGRDGRDLGYDLRYGFGVPVERMHVLVPFTNKRFDLGLEGLFRAKMRSSNVPAGGF